MASGHRIEKEWMTAAGLRAKCVVVAFSHGDHHRCGYVEVPSGHPLFGADYSGVDVSVHGGLTFSDPWENSGWWFGFDCAHFGDGEIVPIPGMQMPEEFVYPPKSLEFVVAECESLAAQLADYVTKNMTRKPAEWGN